MTLRAYDDRTQPLVPFGDRAAAAARCAVAGEIARDAGSLALSFDVVAPADALRVAPPAAVPQRRDELWRRTCFEAFLAPESGPAYWEVNVAPSGDWNVYRFAGYRTGGAPEARVHGVATSAVARDGTLAVRAALDVAAISELASGTLAVGLAAVLEARDGSVAYFALCHPGERPDFHRRDGFTARIA